MPASELEPRQPAPAIRIRDVPAAAGLVWIRRGMRAFARRPGGFLALFGVMLLAMIALLMVPAVLRLLALALTPLVSLGFMIATEAVQDDLPVHPGMFVQPLAAGAPQRAALLRIGLCYVAMAAAVLLLGDRIDGGEAERWIVAMSTPRPDGSLPEPPPLSALGTAVLVFQLGWAAFVSVPLWYAPALVHWGRQGAAHAMFSSVVALWHTKAAFAMYQLGWCFIGAGLGPPSNPAALALGDPRTAVVLMIPLMSLLTIAFYASLWQGFIDTFEIRGLGMPLDLRGPPGLP